MKQIRAVVFDFDGTLVASNIDFARMRREIVEHLKTWQLYSHQFEQQRYVLEMVACGREALRDRPAHAQAFERQAMSIIESIEMQTCPFAVPYEGVQATLQELSALGYGVGVITRNGRMGVEAITSRFPLHYDVLLTRSDVEHTKPHPEHLLKALQALQTPPAQAIMVGDHPTDMACGQAAGVTAIGISANGTRSAELARAGAALVIPNVAHLLTVLTKSSPQQNPST